MTETMPERIWARESNLRWYEETGAGRVEYIRADEQEDKT